ncbi:MAG: sensor histidine kinase [Phycisphaerales bacterium]|nr:sensor histidine kinase [Phycisphaerales bacterium]
MPKRLLIAVRRPSAMPLRVLLAVLLLVFAVEFGIMLALPAASERQQPEWTLSLIDSLTLTVLLTPALWLLVVRPLQRLSESRGRLLGNLLSAQEDERARIALDLHDELGQQLTAVLIGARAVRDATTLQAARERSEAVTAAAGSALESVRAISRGLRPPALNDLGLRPALERLADEFRSVHDIEVEMNLGLGADDRFSGHVETCIYRLVQEALTNVSRHSGARCARVCVSATARGVEASVSDDGKGFDAGSVRPGVGLAGMRERIAALGGELDVEAAPGRGVRVAACVPAEGTSGEARA